jgi:hypothetical protein
LRRAVVNAEKPTSALPAGLLGLGERTGSPSLVGAGLQFFEEIDYRSLAGNVAAKKMLTSLLQKVEN